MKRHLLISVLLTTLFTWSAQYASGQSCVEGNHCDSEVDILLDCPDVPTWTEYFWDVREIGHVDDPSRSVSSLIRQDGSDYYFTPSAVDASWLGREVNVVLIQGSPGDERGWVPARARVMPSPASYNLVGPNEVCVGEPFTLSLENSEGLTTSYRLYIHGSGSNVGVSPGLNGQIDFDVTNGVVGDYIYYVIADNGICQTTMPDSDPSNGWAVKVNAAPSVTLETDDPANEFCDGDLITFTALGADEYAFYLGSINPGNELQARSTDNTYDTNTLSDGDVVVVEGFDTSTSGVTECSASTSVTVVIQEVPTGVISGDNTICEGESTNLTFTLTGTGPWDIVYTDGTTDFNVTANASPHVVAITPAVGTITYTLKSLSDSGGCPAGAPDLTGSATVIVNELPTGDISGTATICNGESTDLTFTFTGTAPWNLVYTDGTTDFPVNNIATSPHVISVSPIVNTSYTIKSLTDANIPACSAATLTGVADITVNSRPTSLMSGDASICEGETTNITIDLTGTADWDIEYTDGFSTFNATASASPFVIPVTPVTNPAGSQTVYNYQVTALSDANCTAQPTDITGTPAVTVNPIPSVTLNSDQPGDEFCAGTDVEFTAGNADEYEFYRNAINPGNIVQARSTDNTFNTTGLADGDVIYVVGYDTNYATDCNANASVTVVVNEVVASISISAPVPGGTEICAGTPVTFNASAIKTPVDPTASFIYDFRRIRGVSDQSVQNGASSTYTDNALIDGDVIYVVISEANSGCSDNSLMITITVNPNPAVTLLASPNPVCEDEDVTFTATPGFANYEFFVNSGSEQSSALNTYTTNTLVNGDEVYVSATSDKGCSASSAPPVSIVVNPLPVPSISGNLSPCNGDVERYTTDAGNSNYVWTFTGGAFVGGGNGFDYIDIQWNSTGSQTVTVSYRNSDGCDPAAPSSQNVTVNSLPVISIAGNEDVCLNSTETYSTQTGMTNYSWNVVGGSIQSDDGNGTITVLWNTIGNGTVSVNYENAAGCDAATDEQLAINVHPLPTPTISGNDPVCLNAIETYTTQNGYSNYDWVVVGGTIIPTANPHIVDVQWTSLGSQSISVNYEATAGNCKAATPFVLPVEVNALPVPTIGGPTDVCLNSTGNTYTTETGMSGYSWTISGGIIDSGNGSNTVSVTWNTAGTGTISVSYTDANGCEPTNPTDYVVNVNSLPVPSITGASTVCLMTTEAYTTDPGMSNYFWTVSAGGTIVGGQNTQSIDVEWTTNGTKSITVTYTDTNNCDPDSPSSTNVTVVDLPNPTISGSDNVCEGHTVTYTTQAGGTNYDWQIVGGVITPSADEHIVDVVWTLGAGRQISVNYELASCPASTPFVLPVTVNPIPTVALTGANEACLNSTGHVYTTDAGQNNYTWTVTGGTFGPGASPEEIIVTWDTQGAGSVEVNYDNSSGCSAVNPSRIDVTVHALPVVTITGNDVVCNTYREVYTTEPGMSSYNWLVTGGVIDVDDNNGRIEVIWNTVGSQTISVSYEDANNCSPAAPQVLNVTVNDTPVPNIIGDTDACVDNVKTYSTQTGFNNYNWIVPAEGTIISGTGTESIDVLWTAIGTHTISVNYENTSNCSGLTPATLDVTVNPLAGVALNVVPGTSVIIGTEVTFTASGTDVVNYDYKVNGNLQTGHDGSETFRWTPADIGDDNTVVRVIAETSNGCKDSTEITISVFEGLFPSNVEPSTQTYCEGSPETISIYLVPPILANVTYELIRTDDAQSIGTVLVTDAADEVRWTHGVNGVDLEYNGTATYKIEAYWPAVPGDKIDMSNTVQVTEIPLPNNTFSIQPTGDVTGCNGGIGYEVTLDGSEPDVDYYLLVGSTPVAGPVSGTGGTISFGNQLTTGIYTVSGERNGCPEVMAGTFEIKSDWSGTSQDVVGDPTHGRFCTGGLGIEVILQSSEVGVNYIVSHNGSEITGSDWTGDGNSHTFGPYDQVGDYTVSVKTVSGCYYPMNGLVTVIEESLPTAFNLLALNNIPSYCPGEAGVQLLLDNKEVGVRYTLYQDNNPVEDILATSDGGQLVFTGIYPEGNYTVRANVEGITCEEDMANDLDVVIDPEPIVLDLMGETSFCEGGGSVGLYINNPENDVTYELYLDGNPTGNNGTVSGGQIVWDVAIEAEYTVQAVKNNAQTDCGPVAMNNAINVVMTLLPEDRVLNVVDGTDCSNGTIITIPNTQNNIRYVVVSMSTDLPVPGYEIIGNGSDASFAPIFDSDGYYRVEAYNNTCLTTIDDTYNNPIHVQIAGVVGKRDITYIPSGPICVGSGNITIQVNIPETNIDYVLYRIDAMNNDIPVDTILSSHATDPIEFDALFAEGTYKVIGYADIINDPSGCSNEMLNQVTLTYNPLPKSFRLYGADKYCSTDPAILTLDGSEGNYEYTLLRDDGSGNVLVDTKIGDGGELQFIPVNQDGAYTVYSISPDGCTSSMRDTVTVSAGTDIDMQIASSNTLEYCSADGSVEISLQNQQDGVLYQVLDASSVVVAEATGDNSATHLVLGSVSDGSYTIWGSYNGMGCITQMNNGDPVDVTELSSPLTFGVSSNVNSVCGNVGAQVILSGSEDGRVYSILADGFDLGDSQTGDVAGNSIIWNVTESVGGTVIYEVIALSSGTCDLSMGTVSIDYKEAPEKPVAVSTDIQYCFGEEGATVSLLNTQVGFDYYIVNSVTSERIGWLTGTGNPEAFNEYIGAGTYYIIAKSFDNGCENRTDTDIIIIEYSEIPEFNITVGKPSKGMTTIEEDEIGVGSVNVDSIGLNNSTLDITYTLLKDGNPYAIEYVVSGNGSPFVYDNSPSDGGIYTIRAEENGCLRDMLGSVRLEVKPLIANDTLVSVKKGENEKLVVVHENDDLETTVLDIIGANIKFSLIDPNVNPTPDPNEDGFTPLLAYESIPRNKFTIDANTGQLQLIKTPSFYGRDSVSYLIYNTEHTHRFDHATVHFFIGNADVDEENNLLIPNAFSPNGDKYNEKFVISGSYGEGPESVSESKLEVFNRWGTVIYRSKGNRYGEDDSWWDGTSNAGAMVSLGEKLPSGTYFYVYTITINDSESGTKTKEFSGYIELRR